MIFRSRDPVRDGLTGNRRHDMLKGLYASKDERDERGNHGSHGDGVYPLTLFYDAACPLCHGEMSALMLRNDDGRLRFVDVSAPGFTGQPAGVTQADLLALMHAQTASGRIVKGVDVFRLAYAAAGLPALSRAISLPVLGRLAEWAYPVLARHRYRLPRRLVTRLFEGTVQRAAERAAAARCDGDACATRGASAASPRYR